MVNREDCYSCLGTGKIKIVPWTDAPIWERLNEEIGIDCDVCQDS